MQNGGMLGRATLATAQHVGIVRHGHHGCREEHATVKLAQAFVECLRGVKANEANGELFPLYLNKSDMGFIINFGNGLHTAESPRKRPNLALTNLSLVRAEPSIQHRAQLAHRCVEGLHCTVVEVIATLNTLFVCLERVTAKRAVALHQFEQLAKMVAQATLGRQSLKSGGKITAFERSRKHSACSVGQVVCLVHKHCIFTRGCILAKIAVQMHLRIENIVIVTNNDVAKLGKLELQLIRANVVFSGNFFYNRTAVSALSLQNLANGKRCALVKVACARTVHGVAMTRNTCGILFGFFIDADLLACREHHGAMT